LMNFSSTGWMDSLCLTFLLGSFLLGLVSFGRNAHSGSSIWQVPDMLRSRAVLPQRWTTTESDLGIFGTPNTTVCLISGTLHPIPAASIAQIIRNCPDLNPSQIAAFPRTDMVEEYAKTSPHRCGGSIFLRTSTLWPQALSESKYRRVLSTSSALVLASSTTGRIVFKTSNMGFFASVNGQVINVRFGRSQPASNPQNGRLPNPHVFHITSNVDVVAVAVHATKGTSCPVYIRSSSNLRYCGRNSSPPPFIYAVRLIDYYCRNALSIGFKKSAREPSPERHTQVVHIHLQCLPIERVSLCPH
jgi:hypothetical protein